METTEQLVKEIVEAEPIGQSPMPSASTPSGLTFLQAMQEIIAGKKVARASWTPNKDYCFMAGEYVSIYREATNKVHEWLINTGDIQGTDWKVIS